MGTQFWAVTQTVITKDGKSSFSLSNIVWPVDKDPLSEDDAGWDMARGYILDAYRLYDGDFKTPLAWDEEELEATAVIDGTQVTWEMHVIESVSTS